MMEDGAGPSVRRFVLTLMAEANAELESLLAQSTDSPLHQLGNLRHRGFSLGMLSKFGVMSFRPCHALSLICFLGQFICS
jgi:hypothetical protein